MMARRLVPPSRSRLVPRHGLGLDHRSTLARSTPVRPPIRVNASPGNSSIARCACKRAARAELSTIEVPLRTSSWVRARLRGGTVASCVVTRNHQFRDREPVVEHSIRHLCAAGRQLSDGALRDRSHPRPVFDGDQLEDETRRRVAADEFRPDAERVDGNVATQQIGDGELVEVAGQRDLDVRRAALVEQFSRRAVRRRR